MTNKRLPQLGLHQQCSVYKSLINRKSLKPIEIIKKVALQKFFRMPTVFVLVKYHAFLGGTGIFTTWFLNFYSNTIR